MMPKVTIAIPTHNRGRFLPKAIESVLSQTYSDFELLVVDNASTDNTKKVVKQYKDSRLRYYRNKSNIGMINNWNRCVKLARGKYLVILGDDDLLYPIFLEESTQVHQKYKLGFSFTHCNKVDSEGKIIVRWGYNFPPAGLLKGEKYLELTIKYGACLTNSSTVLLNTDIFNKIGLFEGKYASNTFDFNMWIRIANEFDVYFIDKVLIDYRIHKDQVSEVHWRRKERRTGKIGTYLEIFNAIACLMGKFGYYKNEQKRKFLLDKILEYDKELSFLLRESIPEL